MNERITKQIEEMKKQTIGVEVEMNNIRRDKAAELAAGKIRQQYGLSEVYVTQPC